MNLFEILIYIFHELNINITFASDLDIVEGVSWLH